MGLLCKTASNGPRRISTQPSASTVMSASPSLRVLHVYSGNLYGGIETFLRTLAVERAQCPEMDPEFALCFEGRLADEIRASGARLHMLGGARLSRPWTILRARRRLARVLREREPTVVVSHASWPHALFASVVKRSEAKLVFYRHDIGQRLARLNLLAGLIRPDAIIANSNFTAEHGHPSFGGVPTHVVHYVIQPPAKTLDDKSRASVRRSLGVSDNELVILQASRMQEWKGQRLLVEALPLLPQSSSWRCWFVGGAQRASEKDYVADLRARVEANGLASRVAFLGQRADVDALIDAADVFCQPNVAPEPFGIVFVEALAGGLPVLTTTVAGGALETLTQQCSLICAPNKEALAATLEQLLVDNGLRKDLSAAAVERAATFTDIHFRFRELAAVLSQASA